MIVKYTFKYTLLTMSLLILAVLLAAGTQAAVAQAHDGEDHSTAVMLEDTDRIEKMKQLVAILQQLVELLGQQAGMMEDHMHDTHAAESMIATALSVKVEVHDGRTHVHAQKPGDATETAFFLDDVMHTDEVAVIAAVATRLGVTEAEVKAVIMFPEDGDDHEHESTETEDEHEHEDGDDDHEGLDGIHIMADGTVMLGNGEVVEDATVNEEGMIVLSDGTEVEPEMDLR